MSSSPNRGDEHDRLRLNDAVHVERESHQQRLEGVVAFLGRVMFARGDDWVGVRLTGSSVGLGRNDGSVQGVRYFTCGPQNGIFVRRQHVTRRSLSKLEELRMRRDAASRNSPHGSSTRSFSSSPGSRTGYGNETQALTSMPGLVPSRGIGNSPRTSISPRSPNSKQSENSDQYDSLLDDILESGVPATSENQMAIRQHRSAAYQAEKPESVTGKKHVVGTGERLRDAPRDRQPHMAPSANDNSLTRPLLEADYDTLSPPPSLRQRVSQPRNDNPHESHLRPTTPASSSHKRILDRDAAFHQSRGRWSVQRMSQGSELRRALTMRRRRCWRLCDDWFHNLAYKRTLVLMLILFLLYASAVFFFAFVYRVVNILGAKYTTSEDGTTTESPFCGMDLTNHMEALYFSLSTMTTIGYGVSDYYFGDCWTPLILVLWQVCTAITFDAVAIGLLFLRISRGRKRGKTIIFSDKAVIRRVRGCPYLMFRIGELRKNYIIEATVRVYCVRHERYPVEQLPRQEEDGGSPSRLETTHFVTRHVDLVHPDETKGSHILMSLPQVVVHKMNGNSPLVPPPSIWCDEAGREHRVPQAIGRVGKDGSPRQASLEDYSNQKNDIQDFHMDRGIEIVVLVEGTDEVTGSALQARHSYCWDDIAWDHTFAPCVFPCSPGDEDELEPTFLQERGCRRRVKQPACCINFDMFHEIKEVPADCDSCPFIPQHSS